MRRGRFGTYNSGVLWVCDNVAAPSDFSAPVNAGKQKDLQMLQKLDFQERSRREEDMAFAESNGRKLTLKVKCPFRPNVSPKHHVLIGRTLYSIIKIDGDTAKRNMYILLEEERTI